MKTSTAETLLKPFLRWAGGKSALAQHLLQYVPKLDNSATYYEPFLGAGAMFFAIKPQRAVLGDLNNPLIECYREVRERSDLVSSYLKEFSNEDSEEFYYDVRDTYNNAKSSARQAARFIYLNKASFNGIFRVNKSGHYNVPYGYRKNLGIPCKDTLCKISSALESIDLMCASYELTLEGAQKNDFVYLDPPYPPLNGTSYFTHYTTQRFVLEDQENVAKLAARLSVKGCRVMISNADTPAIRELYRSWKIRELNVVRWVTCKKLKHKVSELVITNY